MKKKQLDQIRNFCKKYYQNTGRYHAWDHIELVRKSALNLVEKYPKANKDLLEAACYIHDIGRVVRDEGHPQESAKLVKPLLKKISLTETEIFTILDAVSHHDKAEIESAKSLEAKLLFDADKLQIVTVFGFTRCLLWLVEERQMAHIEALAFLHNYVNQVVKNYLQTPEARKIASAHLPIINTWVEMNQNWVK